jgi:hypothetical protein
MLGLLSLAGCPNETRDDKRDAPATSARGSSSSASVAASSPPPSPATSSAGAPADNPLVAAFKEDAPPAGTTRSILRDGQPAGVNVVVPKEFEAGSGVYGGGYTTGTAVNGVQTSAVGFEVQQLTTPDPTVPKLDEARLTQFCYASKVTKLAWEPGVEVKVGPSDTPALVWKGKGTHVGGKGEWGAYVISAVFDGTKRVIGCGAWNTEKADLEQQIILVLKSLRTGPAAPTDPGYP